MSMFDLFIALLPIIKELVCNNINYDDSIKKKFDIAINNALSSVKDKDFYLENAKRQAPDLIDFITSVIDSPSLIDAKEPLSYISKEELKKLFDEIKKDKDLYSYLLKKRNRNDLEEIKKHLLWIIDHINSNDNNTIRNLTNRPSKSDTSNVIGRERDLNKLWETLVEKHHVILTGFGGIGKTKLAKMLYHTYESQFDEVAWINYQGNLKKSFLSSITVKALQFDGDEEKRWDNLKSILINDKQKKLFVIDNVDYVADQHPEQDADLYELTGWDNTTILLTSRLDRLEDYHIFSLDFLALEDCVKVFNQYYPGKETQNQKTVADLVELANRHTLTIELLAKGAWQYDIKEYYDIVKEGFEKVDAIITTKYRKEKGKITEDTIDGHLKFLFKTNSLKPMDKEVLYGFAILPTNCECTISELEQWFGFKKKDCSIVIHNGWLTYDEERGIYSLHPLVRTIIHFDFSEDDENKRNIALQKTADKILKYFASDEKLFKIDQGRISLQRIIGITESVMRSVAQAENERFSALNHNIGFGYNETGDYDKALEYYSKALAIREKIFSIDHPETANSYNAIGLAYWHQKNYQKALEHHFTAMEIRERVLGTEHPDTAKSYNDIGILYDEQYDYDNALYYYQKSLPIFEKHGTKPLLAANYNNIGKVYKDKCDYDNAMEFFFKALTVLDSKHYYNGSFYNNIGRSYYELSDYESALFYLFKALEIRERIFGEHPFTATSYSYIGSVYNNQSDYDEALVFFSKALSIRERVFGINHPETAYSYDNFGSMYYNRIEYEKAWEFYQRALLIREKTYGTKSPNTAISYNNMGTVYMQQGDYDVAMEYYLKALSIREEVLGAVHLDTACSYNDIGTLYMQQRDYNKAIEYYLKTLVIREKTLGEGNPHTAASYDIIGTTYMQQDDYDTATEYFLKALQ